jgi:hypothetical protein
METYDKSILQYNDVQSALRCMQKETCASIAKTMFLLLYPTSEIAKITGLSEKDINFMGNSI